MESTQPSSPPIPPLPTHSTAESPTTALLVSGIWMLVLALFLLVGGLISVIGYVSVPFLVKNNTSALQANIFLGVFAGLGLAFGGVWAWQGIATWRGRAPSSAARALPHLGVLVSAFLLALLGGWSVLQVKPIAAFAFPPFHLLASVLPPVIFVAYAAHRLGATSGVRALIASLGWGALGGTFLALSLEVIIGVIIVVLVGLVLGGMPEGEALLRRLGNELQAMRRLGDQTIVQWLLAHPAIIAVGTVYFAVLVPLIEEAFKTLIIAFVDPRRTTARDAVLWGIAAGAGFALVESALNTSLALDVWIVAMLTRIGATVMHVANGVTMARGWYAARVERRWHQLLVAYGVSVFLHAAWNALAIGQGISALYSTTGAQGTIDLAAPLAWFTLVLLLGLIALVCGGVGWIVYSVQKVREPALEKI